MSREKLSNTGCIMVTGTGKSAISLDKIFCGPVSPVSSLMDLEGPNQVQTSSRCVFLTLDRKDCMAFCERCSWVINQGLCIRPRQVRPGARCV
jgi:hypothetical protein